MRKSECGRWMTEAFDCGMAKKRAESIVHSVDRGQKSDQKYKITNWCLEFYLIKDSTILRDQ